MRYLARPFAALRIPVAPVRLALFSAALVAGIGLSGCSDDQGGDLSDNEPTPGELNESNAGGYTPE